MAAVDVSAVVSEVVAQAAPIAAIGVAVLVLLVGIKAFRWLHGALGASESEDYSGSLAEATDRWGMDD